MIDIVQMVREGQGFFEWVTLTSDHQGFQLHVNVMRDALKFDGVPAMNFKRIPLRGDSRTFDGVRLPATAHEMQQIADLLNCVFLTPKVIDLVWLNARVKFDSVVNIKGQIVATSNIHDVHTAIQKAIQEAGGDNGTGIVSCVGKYWCLIEQLAHKGRVHGDYAACNYGWFAKRASGPGLTFGTQCWQRPGYRHNKLHLDPSQTVRLMGRHAVLIHPGGYEENVDVLDILQNDRLCPLLTHDGKPLTYLRQAGVPEEKPLERCAPFVLPEVIISGDVPKGAV
jgi:hypothetical protein